MHLLLYDCYVSNVGGGGERKKEAGKDRDLPSGQNVSCHPFQRKRKSVRSVNGGVERMKEEEEEEEKVWKRQKDGGGRGEMELRREGGKGGRCCLLQQV